MYTRFIAAMAMAGAGSHEETWRGGGKKKIAVVFLSFCVPDNDGMSVWHATSGIMTKLLLHLDKNGKYVSTQCHSKNSK
jgi:hypothetical protein